MQDSTSKYAMINRYFKHMIYYYAVLSASSISVVSQPNSKDITYNMISMGSQGADVGARIALLKYLGMNNCDVKRTYIIIHTPARE